MCSSDLKFAALCTAEEVWLNETQQEFEGFFAHDPNGCFIAELDKKPVGIGIATSYGVYGFICELIVSHALRGQGIGRALPEYMIGYLHRRGVQNILLDGVLRAVPLCERVGFRKVCRSLRFIGKPKSIQHPKVRNMEGKDLPSVKKLDRQGFNADRGLFFECRLSLYPDLCKVMYNEGEIVGFILGRRGNGQISADPWMVQIGIDHPEILLHSLASETNNLPFAVSILESNPAAVEFMHVLDLEENPFFPLAYGTRSSIRAGNFSNGIRHRFCRQGLIPLAKLRSLC